MKIVKVFPDSLGEAIGVHPGDRLLKINGKRVQDEIDYQFRITEELLTLELEIAQEIPFCTAAGVFGMTRIIEASGLNNFSK